MKEWKKRLIAAAVFLALSLGLFLLCALDWWSTPAARVAKRYMNAAIKSDYMALYHLFDPSVLEREMEQGGMDEEGLEQVAQTNAQLVEQFVAGVESDYGVRVAYTYAVTEERELTPEQLELLTLAYDADGFPIELLDGRHLTVRAAAKLTGEKGTEKLERELELTVLQTPRGWCLDRDSMYVFWELLYALPGFAWEHFGL